MQKNPRPNLALLIRASSWLFFFVREGRFSPCLVSQRRDQGRGRRWQGP